jgi:hypothetical protein
MFLGMAKGSEIKERASGGVLLEVTQATRVMRKCAEKQALFCRPFPQVFERLSEAAEGKILS